MRYSKENPIRKLARSDYWQSLYARAKEISTIGLFKNRRDFSDVQVNFLNWLEIYSSLYGDLYTKEQYISEKVINDEIRCDAYLLYRRKKRDKEKKEQNKSNTGKSETVDGYQGIPVVNFE